VERKQLRLLIQKLTGVSVSLNSKLVDDQVAKLGPTAHRRLSAIFRSKSLEYPPDKLALVALINPKQIQIYVANGGRPYKFVHSYNIEAPNTDNDPKSKFSDSRDIAGIYHVTSLEPSRRWHLGLKIAYPNKFDLSHAKGMKSEPGELLLIHGAKPVASSLMVADQDSEDLFILAYDTKDRDIPVVVSPIDLRVTALPAPTAHDPPWLPELYAKIKTALSEYPPFEQKQK
jgi:murein L,D-transpeptidase YafK